MTAVFFFKDESSMKARQTVFFAYKSPEAASSLERERRSDAMPSNLGKYVTKISRCNAAHKWLRLLNAYVPGFICVRMGCTTLPKKGIVCSVCLRMGICTSSVGKNSHMMFCCKSPPPPHTPLLSPCKRACPLGMTTTSGMPQRPPNRPIV